MKGYLSPANLMTSGNLVAGFVAVILAAQGEFAWAAGCVAAAAVLDSLDGLLARHSRAECEFGAQLDSLADLVSFGAAPATTMYLSVLEGVPLVGIVACVVFVLFGAWRLARFAIVANSRQRFVGLPVPPAGVVVVSLAALHPPAAVALVLTLGLTLLMVTSLPFPTLSALARLGRSPRASRERKRRWLPRGARVRLGSRLDHRGDGGHARGQGGAFRHRRKRGRGGGRAERLQAPGTGR